MWDRVKFPTALCGKISGSGWSSPGPAKEGLRPAARAVLVLQGSECTRSSWPPVCVYSSCVFNPHLLFHPAPSGITSCVVHPCAASQSFCFCALMTGLRNDLVSFSR